MSAAGEIVRAKIRRGGSVWIFGFVLSGFVLAESGIPGNGPAMDHHVYFWLKEEFKSAAAKAEFEAGLAGLFGIGLAAGGRWAVPAAVTLRPVVDQSWDYALTMRFHSLDDHNEYQDHPDHHAFITAFKERWAKVLVMDLA